MNRRGFLTMALGFGAALTATAGAGEALAAMPIARPQQPPPLPTTAEVQPGRDALPAAENAQFVRRRRRVVFVRPRRRRVIVVRRRRRRFF